MHKQFNFLLILIFTFLVVACKNEDTQKESLEVVAGKSNVTRAKKKELTPAQLERANSVMARLIIIPESKKFARYLIRTKIADKLSNEKGPFIIFAPSDNIVESMSEEKKKFYSNQNNLSQLEGLLKSHIVEENLDNKSLLETIRKNGKAKLKTLEGITLTATESEGKLVISDEKGGKVTVQKSDIPASNGQVYLIDGVLNLP